MQVWQLQEPFCNDFVDLEKAFDCVPRKILWWVMRRVEVKEWVILAVKAMYENAKSCVRLDGQFIEKLNIKVGVHQGLSYLVLYSL